MAELKPLLAELVGTKSSDTEHLYRPKGTKTLLAAAAMGLVIAALALIFDMPSKIAAWRPLLSRKSAEKAADEVPPVHTYSANVATRLSF